MAKIISTNPAKNYEVVGEVEISSDEKIAEKVKNAKEAKLIWKGLGVKKRIDLIKPIYEEFLNRKEELIELIIKEIGKTRKEASIELNRYSAEFKWFLDNGEKSLKEEATYEDDETIHKVYYEPFGVSAVITPWNYPFGMFVWGVIPNLIVGNTVVFKHSEECPLSGKLIEDIMLSKHLPRGVFNEIYGAGSIGSKLLNQDVNLIWFTGSSRTGKEIYKIAANKFIKVVLEMGGSNPGIIFKDADIDRFIDKLYAKRFIACGQSCDALKRLIVEEPVFDEVIEKLKRKVESKIVGEPDKEDTDFGSLVAKRQLDLLEAQVKDAIDKGAKVITGGKRPNNLKGAYYMPTILTNIKKNMRVWNEEVFGPVLVVVPFKDEEEAISLANDTRYGLGSLIFTSDIKKAERVASKIEAGTVEINSANHWLTCNPFGGYKESGMGREHGIHGFRELCQIKVVSEEKI